MFTSDNLTIFAMRVGALIAALAFADAATAA
jgi:hypothetical protein